MLALLGTMVALQATVAAVLPSLSGTTAAAASSGTLVVLQGTELRPLLRSLPLALAQGQVPPALIAPPLLLEMSGTQ